MTDHTSTDDERVHRYHGKPPSSRLTARPTLVAGLDHQAAVHGDAPYLTTIDQEGAVTTLTYRQFDRLSRRLTHWLAHELGARSGQVFGLLPVNDAISALTVLALMRLGCPVLMLSPSDPPARVARQAAFAHARAVLHGPTGQLADRPGGVPLPNPRTLPDPTTDVRTQPDPSADALLFATSGSTATSKLVAQSHYNSAVNAEALRRHHGLGPGVRFLGCLPAHHVNGLHFTLLGTLAAGAHAVIADRFDPFTYPHLLTRHRPHIASVVPSVLEALLDAWRHPHIPDEFRYFVSAAAPLTATTVQALHKRLGARVLQGYGLTETTNFSTTMPIDLTPQAYARLALHADIPSIGTALYGNEIAVRTADGRRAEPGETGELCMRGHNVMTRYAGNEDATRQAFRDGWFHSQDLGFAVPDEETGKTFYVTTGRIKNIAKVRGESVSLEEMERVLRAHPAVHDAACITRPDRLLGETITAAVAAAPELSDAECYAHLQHHFATATLPERIVHVEAVPRTATGKILRPQLAAMLRTDRLPAGGHCAPAPD
ncbi:class I adenylate-forming enzyme family protein [Streptomyces gilvosporeus]|uniref:Acyl--CoA ligase n=1 Tax=Streptomyces gilvosporeus TaxID=553510 RepID=A0A1V0TJZ7_9ACTN|nr:class I adenylate-forming enzyme family protein [Streptomyces gilvosporeus]ARF53265.1 acyl--CoA ligase [Streptomyces gilvosporeus]